jgi:Vitamin K-dependent gamma-carboxylase
MAIARFLPLSCRTRRLQLNVRTIVQAWNRFFFRQESPLPLAVFRIAYGLAVVATLLLLKNDWLAWYGPHAWMSLDTMRELEPGARLNILAMLPQDNLWINLFFWIFLTSAVMLAAGLLTRANSILVFVCLASLQQRNLYVLHGGDTFLRVAGFFLMFSPAGAALSLDRLIRIRRGREPSTVPLRSPWAQRMIQIELSFMYLTTVLWKLQGMSWLRGTALSYVYHLFELQRFPIPDWVLLPGVLRLGTWFALVVELSLGTLIWIKPLRKTMLIIGLLFHLFLEYSLNVPMFQWDILTAYLLFVDADAYTRAWDHLKTWALGRVNVPTH